MSGLDEFFSNKNWENGGEGDDDWTYIGSIDPHLASAELTKLREGFKFPLKIMLALIEIGKMHGVEFENMQRWIVAYGGVKGEMK